MNNHECYNSMHKTETKSTGDYDKDDITAMYRRM